MKDMNEIDKILEKKYKEIKVPDKMFDTTKLFKRIAEEKKRKKKIVKVACILVTVFLVIGATIVGIKISNNSKIEENVENINASSENESVIEIAGKIQMKKTANYTNQIHEFVSIIEVKEILGYEIIDGVPSTRVKASVEKNYLNDLEGDVEMIIPGGTFIVKEIKNLLGIKDNDDLSKYKDNQYVEIECKEDIYIAKAIPEKKYITTTYEKDGILYICSDVEYGFKEYDESTNTIKDADGNSVDVDMENYLKGK